MQPQYNLLVREVEWEILPASRHAGLGLLPWSPLGGGWLTGKYTRDLAPHGDTRLGENPDADGMEAWGRRKDLARTWDVLAALRRIAESRNVSMANVALAWLASRPGIASIILGARTADQLVHNIESFDLDLDPDESNRLTRQATRHHRTTPTVRQALSNGPAASPIDGDWEKPSGHPLHGTVRTRFARR